MGCSQRKSKGEQLTHEEQYFKEQEARFGLNTEIALNLFDNIRFYSIEKLSITQLKDALVSSGWTADNRDGTTFLEKYIDQYCKYDDGFDSKRIMILGLLLGTDALDIKATILFQICDPNVTGKVNRNRLDEILTYFTDHALDDIPNFVLNEASVEKRVKLSKFKTTINLMSKTIVEFMSLIIIEEGDSIDQEDFTPSVLQSKARYLFSSVELRNFAIKSDKRFNDFKRYVARFKNSDTSEINLRSIFALTDRANQPEDLEPPLSE